MRDSTADQGPTVDITVNTQNPQELIFLGAVNRSADISHLGLATIDMHFADDRGNVTFDNVGHSSNFLLFPTTYDAGTKNSPSSLITQTYSPIALRTDGSITPIKGEQKGALEQSVTVTDIAKREVLHARDGNEFDVMVFDSSAIPTGFPQSKGSWVFDSKTSIDSNGSARITGLQENAAYILKSPNGDFSRPFLFNGEGIERF